MIKQVAIICLFSIHNVHCSVFNIVRIWRWLMLHNLKTSQRVYYHLNHNHLYSTMEITFPNTILTSSYIIYPKCFSIFLCVEKLYMYMNWKQNPFLMDKSSVNDGSGGGGGASSHHINKLYSYYNLDTQKFIADVWFLFLNTFI